MNWRQWAVIILVLVVLAAAGAVALHFLGTWLYVHAGIKGFGPYYGFWSGFGSDFGEFAIPATILLALGAWYRRHNCEVDTCIRLGRHDTAAGHTVCRRHHPDDKLSHADVLEAHHKFLKHRE